MADVERYTLLITHSFHRGHLEGNSNRLQGHYLECVPVDRGALEEFTHDLDEQGSCDGEWVRKQVECINDSCRKMQEMGSKGTFHLGGRGSAAFLQNSSVMAASLVDDSEQHSEDWTPEAQRPGAKGREPQLLAAEKASQPTPLLMDTRAWETELKRQQDEDKAHEKESRRPDVGKFNPPDVFAIKDGDIFKLSKILEPGGPGPGPHLQRGRGAPPRVRHRDRD